MGPQALRMNLNILLRHDVFCEPHSASMRVLATSAMVDYVADRIADESEIRRSKQFPHQYFAAYLNADDF
jgi:60 kDa SS-A/Ro ribonucleoprotein